MILPVAVLSLAVNVIVGAEVTAATELPTSTFVTTSAPPAVPTCPVATVVALEAAVGTARLALGAPAE